MIVRKIRREDLDQTFNLLNELYDNRIQYDIYSKKYEESLENDKYYSIVAEENNRIIGVLNSRLISRLAKSKDILYIDDLIVDKDYRNNGVGKSLLKNAVEYAKQSDCQTIELTSYITNENAHRFYQNNGFFKKHYEFKYKLD